MYFVKNTQWSICCSCHVLSYHVLIHHLGRVHHLGRKDRATHRNSLFISFAQDFVWVCTYTQIHTHTHTHTLTSALKPKGKNSSMDAIHFYLGYNQNLSKYFRVLPIKISYTSLCNVFVSFLTSPEYF